VKACLVPALVAHKIDGNHDATRPAWPLDADDCECRGMWRRACEEKLTCGFERNHARTAVDDRHSRLKCRAILGTEWLSEPQTQQHDSAC